VVQNAQQAAGHARTLHLGAQVREADQPPLPLARIGQRERLLGGALEGLDQLLLLTLGQQQGLSFADLAIGVEQRVEKLFRAHGP
jgi:hypothetical protein